LAYLSLTNYVDVIITEDSDLLAFGAKRIFYKMDRNGLGQEISLEDLPLCSEYSFANWTNNMFLTLCIMAGCDYLEQIPKVGFKTAFNQIARLKNYRLVISHFMQSGKY
jgi:exonuclease-1